MKMKNRVMVLLAVVLIGVLGSPVVASALGEVYSTRIVPVKKERKWNLSMSICTATVYSKVEYYDNKTKTYKRMPNIGSIKNIYRGYCPKCKVTTTLKSNVFNTPGTSSLKNYSAVSGSTGETKTMGKFSKCPKGHNYSKASISAIYPKQIRLNKTYQSSGEMKLYSFETAIK